MRRVFTVYKDKVSRGLSFSYIKDYPMLMSPVHDAEVNKGRALDTHCHIIISGLKSEGEAERIATKLRTTAERLYLTEEELIAYFEKFGGKVKRFNNYQLFSEKWKEENYELEEEYANIWLNKNKQNIIEFLNEDEEI